MIERGLNAVFQGHADTILPGRHQSHYNNRESMVRFEPFPRFGIRLAPDEYPVQMAREQGFQKVQIASLIIASGRENDIVALRFQSGGTAGNHATKESVFQTPGQQANDTTAACAKGLRGAIGGIAQDLCRFEDALTGGGGDVRISA